MADHAHHEKEAYTKTIFGFWVYLMTDFMMFATLFAVFAVLRHSYFGGPHPSELFSIPYTTIQTALLLLAGFTSGIGGMHAHRGNKRRTIWAFTVTFFLGLGFIAMQTHEFMHLIQNGNGWQRSGYLSAFFTLSGTLWMHMLFALTWIIVLLPPVCLHGLTPVSVKRLTCLRMFWQFLYVVWIFIYGFVYLVGVN